MFSRSLIEERPHNVQLLALPSRSVAHVSPEGDVTPHTAVDGLFQALTLKLPHIAITPHWVLSGFHYKLCLYKHEKRMHIWQSSVMAMVIS